MGAFGDPPEKVAEGLKCGGGNVSLYAGLRSTQGFLTVEHNKSLPEGKASAEKRRMRDGETPHVASNDIKQMEGGGVVGYVKSNEVYCCDSGNHALMWICVYSRSIRLAARIPQCSVKGF